MARMRFLSLFLISQCLLFVSCTDKLPENPSLEAVENYVRKKNDAKAVFTYDQYKELLNELTDEKYIVLPINEFRDSANNSSVMIGLRHDVDHHPFKALEMAKIEHGYNIRSTYYILPTASYYGFFKKDRFYRHACMSEVYNDIAHLGHEIGIHNDLIAVMLKYNHEPYSFNKDDLEFFKSIGIEIHGTAAHGSSIAIETVPNYEIFSDFVKKKTIDYKGKSYQIGQYSLNECGFQYEAYFVEFNKYFAEGGGVWNKPYGLTGVLQELKNSKPGDRIQILTHPVWWGKTP
jgi:hypothetical protein